MEIVFVLVAIGVAFAAAVVAVLVWAVRSGQFDDLEGPAHRILVDEERIVEREHPGTERTEADPRSRRA